MLGVAKPTASGGVIFLSLVNLAFPEIYHSNAMMANISSIAWQIRAPLLPNRAMLRMVLAPDGTQIGEARAEKLGTPRTSSC